MVYIGTCERADQLRDLALATGRIEMNERRTTYGKILAYTFRCTK